MCCVCEIKVVPLPHKVRFEHLLLFLKYNERYEKVYKYMHDAADGSSAMWM